ncbi:MAG: hypothetical protein LBK00_04505 [Treponema sp.]|jgi:hypothetical protein|nr:hypothetical protein [Treponema sp.]
MLKKVAIGQGFRLCFSNELGGMPYTSDELDEERVVTEAPPPDEPDFAIERRALLMSIKETLGTKSPDELPYFDEYAVKRWGDRVREIPRSADGIAALKAVFGLVKARLEALKAEYKPVPFGDEAATSGRDAALAASGEEASAPEPEEEVFSN